MDLDLKIITYKMHKDPKGGWNSFVFKKESRPLAKEENIVYDDVLKIEENWEHTNETNEYFHLLNIDKRIEAERISGEIMENTDNFINGVIDSLIYKLREPNKDTFQIYFDVKKIKTKKQFENIMRKDEFTNHNNEDIVLVFKTVNSETFQPEIVIAIRDKFGILLQGEFYSVPLEILDPSQLQTIGFKI